MVAAVAYFRSAEEVYRYIGGLFEALGADRDLWPSLAAADVVVQYRYRDPECEITVRLRPDEPARVDLGPSELDHEVVMTMDADVAHRFWLGRERARGPGPRADARAGPVAKLLRLLPRRPARLRALPAPPGGGGPPRPGRRRLARGGREEPGQVGDRVHGRRGLDAGGADGVLAVLS